MNADQIYAKYEAALAEDDESLLDYDRKKILRKAGGYLTKLRKLLGDDEYKRFITSKRNLVFIVNSQP